MDVQGLVKRSAAALLLTVGTVACSGSPSGPPDTTPVPPSTTTAPSPTESQDTMTVEVWFTSHHQLYRAERTIPQTQAVGTASLKALFQGPTDEDAASGVGTEIPSDTELVSLSIDGGVATVDLNDAYSMGDSAQFSQQARLGQVVFTLTQFPSVNGVRFELEGSPIVTFDAQGHPVHRPSTREDYEPIVPAILVDTPAVDQDVSSPVTVSGTADVFEAVVSIRILDESGQAIAHTTVMASCGSGCRGEFSEDVEYSVDAVQPGTVVVYEVSAENGRTINAVKIPVTLTA